MLDIALVREQPERVKAALLSRNEDPIQVDTILAPEMNLGQLRFEIERAAKGQAEVTGVNLASGEVLRPENILSALKTAARPPVPA